MSAQELFVAKALVVAAMLVTTSLKGQAPLRQAGGGIEFAADLPLVESDGVPCVNVRMGDGSDLLFGIDTGNVNTCVDLKVAKSAGLGMTAIAPPAPEGFFRATVPVLHLGSISLEGAHVLVFDFAGNQMPKMAGTIAYTAFKDRIVQIDYAAHRVRITNVLSGVAVLPGPSAHFSLITFGKEGPPIVVAQGFELEGKAVSAQLDSMYTGSLLIYTASIPKLGLQALANTPATEFFALTDGGVNMKAAAAASESFLGTALGGEKPKVYFPTPGVHEPDGLFDATVGLGLLRNAVLTLDFHDGTLSVTKPKS
jgi:hypothetical protein